MLQVEHQPLLQQTCEICYCSYDLGALHTLRPSGICYNCWYQHIKTVITQISYKAGSEILSPFEGKDPIDVCIALKSLRQPDEQQLEEFLFKKYSAFTSDIQKCPSQSCDYVFTMDKCKWGGKTDLHCPKCDATLSHGKTFDIKSIVGFIYFLFLTNKCPKCEIPIQKTTGCPHMSCPCGHQFCWYCLKDYYPSNANIYSVHEPKQCASIFISKIVFTSICVAGIFLTLLGNQVFQKCMGYFYIAMTYLFHTLFLDLVIAVNCLLITNLISRYEARSYYNSYNRSARYIIMGMIVVNALIIFGLYFFELLTQSLMIIFTELMIAGVVALTIWMVVLTVDTWFRHIC